MRDKPDYECNYPVSYQIGQPHEDKDAMVHCFLCEGGKYNEKDLKREPQDT